MLAREQLFDQLLVLHSMYPDGFEMQYGKCRISCGSTEALEEAVKDVKEEEEAGSQLKVHLTVDLELDDVAAASAFYSARIEVTFAQPNTNIKLERLEPTIDRAGMEQLRSQLATLSGRLSGSDDDASELVLLAVDELRNRLNRGQQSSTASIASATAPTSTPTPSGSAAAEYRIWFWLISLSTPSKRRDLVTYASSRGLTGFVLAGKPGLVCVEGASELVDEYMKEIKSRSWSDIPSYQKKITERLRQPLLVAEDDRGRAFESMEEITDLIDQRGARGNRGDMKQVREYLERKGLGEVFGQVIGTTGVA